MEAKINIANLLKDCPRGMELDCTMYEDVYFDYVDECNIIHCYIQHETHKTSLTFNQHGTPNSDIKSKCVIFPKGKTTWEGFHKPFEDGDIVISDHGDIHISKDNSSSYCCKRQNYFDATITTHVKFDRLATEEEKQKLFDAIKDNGYKWNEETKTLEKLPKFKVGDKIIKKNGLRIPFVITGVSDVYYWSNTENSVEVLPVADQDDWELVPNKFDVTTLQPFDKVLVRGFGGVWGINIFGFYDGNNKECPFYCIGQTATGWNQCVPYWKNEHLLGTTDDCDDFYKTWE